MTEPPEVDPDGVEAEDQSSLKIWNDVPHESMLTLEMGPANGTFIGQAILGVRGMVVDRWLDADLHPGPKQHLLASRDERYNLIVTATFGLEETAVLTARITGPDGMPHETPYIHRMNGTNGDVDSAVILINMAEEAGGGA
ncbi:MAG TPA: hypothetical protein VN493_28525 [Thermoanaerobaculia bacterium]|nr:hypothetical protein [Thermoanaerobaculia bacterium]